MTPLLAQFLAEGRELHQAGSDGLLALERNPGDGEALNAVFRSFHTMKGAAGIFGFGPLNVLLHAAEDVLGAARAGRLVMGPERFDVLLRALDLVGRWLDVIEQTEGLPEAALAQGTALAVELRSGLARASDRLPPDPSLRSAPPSWAAALLGAACSSAGDVLDADSPVCVVAYAPRADCFFSGDDPLRLALQTPGLLGLELHDRQPWPPLGELDPFQCQVDLRLVSAASRGDLKRHFEYVEDQVALWAVERGGGGATAKAAAPAPAAAASAAALAAVERLLAQQLEVLSTPTDATRREARLASVIRALESAFAFAGDATRVGELAASAQQSLADGSDGPVRALLASWLSGPVERAAAAPSGGSPPPPSPGGATPQTAGAPAARMFRVDQARIDELLDLSGELLVAKNGLSYLARRADQEGQRGLAAEIRERHAGLHRIAEGIQSSVMRIRMMPASVAFQRFPRLVRDVSRQVGKDVALELSGEDVEADKDIIDRLGDPLVHIVRNALDHGCESPGDRTAAGKPPQAHIALRASREGGRLVVEVVDDGRGIDPATVRRKAVQKGLLAEAAAAALTDQEAVDLIFAPGFSTVEQVTDLSGRGVGMDVVLRAVQALSGEVSVRSEKGRGTRVRLALPMTMAVSRVLTIRLAGETMAVPVDAVVEALRVPCRRIRRALDGEIIDWRGRVLPVLELAGLLEMTRASEAREEEPVLVVRRGGEEVGLRVDGFENDVDVVMKPLPGFLANHPALLGSAILGDGRVLLVLNLQEVIRC